MRVCSTYVQLQMRQPDEKKQQEVIRQQVNKALLKMEKNWLNTWKTDYFCVQVGKEEENNHSKEFVNHICTVSSSCLSYFLFLFPGKKC